MADLQRITRAIMMEQNTNPVVEAREIVTRVGLQYLKVRRNLRNLGYLTIYDTDNILNMIGKY